MKDIYELRLAAQIAKLYYQQEMKQLAIAQSLGISQSTVSRLLKAALKNNIVHISIVPPTGVFLDLEEKIAEKYQLKQAIVVDCEFNNETTIMTRLGESAAYYLSSTLNAEDVVGISSWSKTLLNTVTNLKLKNKIGGKIVQILGGVGNPQVQMDATQMITRYCEVTGAKGYFLPANSVAASASVKLAFLSDMHVRKTLSLFPQITVALVGIGSIQPSELLARSGNILPQAVVKKLADTGAVGDICLRFFDAGGKRVLNEIDERIIGISLDELSVIPKTIAIAGGERKVQAIKSAMMGKYCNVLITDKYTARKLVDE